MSKDINTGGPAFPTMTVLGDTAISGGGLTLRDYFAANASNADVLHQAEIIRANRLQYEGIGILPDDWRATSRYMHADAMLAAREGGAV